MKMIKGSDGSIKYMVNDTGAELWILNASGRVIYKYNKAMDQTFDENGNLYMYGNILLDLEE